MKLIVKPDQIGTVGVGETTISALKNCHLLLELDEAGFMRVVMGTFMLQVKSNVANIVAKTSSHQDFLKRYWHAGVLIASHLNRKLRYCLKQLTFSLLA